MHDLRARSITLIKQNQHQSGAYVASPNFPTYRYSWLRDGSFIGYAMLQEQEFESCERFMAWVNTVMTSQRARVEHVVAARRSGRALSPQEFLPARYRLDGKLAIDEWPNFQIDGYGTWLWLLGEYVRAVGDETVLHRYRESIRLTIEYLAEVWNLPNYDCWEENGESIHPSTLACVYGGIKTINGLLGEKQLTTLAEEIRATILNLTVDGRFRKMRNSNSVDASLIWVTIPFGVVEPNDKRMRRTIRLIETKLLIEGGVRRYPEDTYYGGGRWLLLSSWLGWYYARTGKRQKALALLRWVENQSDDQGRLPEQQLDTLIAPEYRAHWEERWGPVAIPLLWSHAMYLILRNELERSEHQD